MSRRKWNYDTIGRVLNGENPFVQVGYTPQTNERKLNDIWTDVKGITWQQKNGYKVRINKQVDSIREQLKQLCSSCKKDIRWGNKYDELFYNKTGKCQECIAKEETEYRAMGLYNVYEYKKILLNKLSIAKEFKNKTEESVKYLEAYNGKIQFLNSDGTIEEWTDNQKSFYLQDAKSDLEKTIKLIDDLNEEIQLLENKCL